MSDSTRRPAPDVAQSRYGPPPRPSSGLQHSQQPEEHNMRVMKRNGQYEPVMFSKIQRRIERLSKGLHVNVGTLVQEVNSGLHDGILASEIDRLSASLAHEKITDHPDYDVLAARIAVSNHHKETMAPFSEVMEALYAPRRLSDGSTRRGQLSDDFIATVRKHSKNLNKVIDYDRDYLLTYFGFRTFEHSYGLRITEYNAKTEKEEERVYERPQHMWMRVAVALWPDDIEAAIETYDWMSCKYFIHASPTLFQAGTRRQQCSSCFLIAMKEQADDDHPDSIEGIYDTLKQCARISKSAGGIGLHISSVRGTGSPITSAGRKSTGLIPMLKPFEQTALYVNQGGKRKGAFAIYLEPFHIDVEDFVRIKLPTGDESRRMRDLHIALFVNDIFMKRVRDDEKWSLMCPFYAPELPELYGEAFEKKYLEYEAMGAPYVRKTMRARDLWTTIVDSQIHTGEPYMVYKDAVNKRSNHQNLGTIRSSNLCSEIVEYSDSTKTAVCNLSSVALNSFVVVEDGKAPYFDHDTLNYVVKMITRNLDRLIDINYYPTEETRNSNMSERPMGIGVQGLADTFMKMRYPFDSPEAMRLNHEIFETMYFASMDASCELAEDFGSPYPSYRENGGSPVANGRLQFDMWQADGYEVKFGTLEDGTPRWDWDALKQRIAQHGVRNSLCIALMPTASTSQLLGNYESFEAATSNMYARNVLSGTYKVVNRRMILDLIDAGLWNEQMKAKILYYGGSIQNIEEIPKKLRDLYKTSYDLSQRVIIDQSADRAPFVDQTQSLNLHLADPSMAAVTSMQMYAWQRGLKTGQYYLRTKPAKRALQVTIDPELEKKLQEQPVKEEQTPAAEAEGWVCTREEGCVTCSS